MIDQGFYKDKNGRIKDSRGKLVHKLDGRKGFETLDRISNVNIWGQIMDLKKNDHRHKGIANTLCDDEIETILATLEFFGAEGLSAIMFDLKGARYRVFDWLAMAVQGRIENEEAVKVLVYSFLKVDGDVDRWIQDLRETDYEVDHSYQSLNLERDNAL